MINGLYKKSINKKILIFSIVFCLGLIAFAFISQIINNSQKEEKYYITNEPISFQLFKEKGSLVLKTILADDHGLQFAKDTSLVKIYIEKGQGQEKILLHELSFSGLQSKEESSYLAQVDDIILSPEASWQRANLIFEIRALYCLFSQGICYQKDFVLRHQRE